MVFIVPLLTFCGCKKRLKTYGFLILFNFHLLSPFPHSLYAHTALARQAAISARNPFDLRVTYSAKAKSKRGLSHFGIIAIPNRLKNCHSGGGFCFCGNIFTDVQI